MNNFVHLHNHTVYSKLDGAISRHFLFQRLKDLGMDCFAKTDHGTLAGSIEFAATAAEHNIKLICGCEFYEVNDIREKFVGVSDDCANPEKIRREDGPDELPDQKRQKYWHVTLLAKDKIGYNQLVRLCSAANSQDAFFFKPRIDKQMLRQIVGEKPGHIFVGTGCAISRLSKTALTSDNMQDLYNDIDYYYSIFGDNMFIELMSTGYAPQKIINKKLIEIGNKTGIPITITNDCHYALHEHARLQDCLVCIGTNQNVDGERKFKFEGSDYYIKSQDELRETFLIQQELDVKPEWFANTRIIADACEHCGFIADKEFKLPRYNVRNDALFKEFVEWARSGADFLGGKELIEQILGENT